MSDEVNRAIELWFFRDLSDEQRYKLGLLCGLPGEAWPTSQIQQKAFLRTVISRLSPSPVPAPLPGSGETKSNYPEIPDGWKLVPVELTKEMIAAVRDKAGMQAAAFAIASWPYLLAASPTNPAETQADEVGK